MSQGRCLYLGFCFWAILALLDGVRSALAQTLTLRQTLRGHSNEVGALAFSPDGRTLASGSSEFESMDDTSGEIKLWDVRTGRLKRTLSDRYNWVTSLAFSPDSRTLASGNVNGDDGGEDVCLWNVTSGKLKSRLAGAGPVVFSPDGCTLATASEISETQSSANSSFITLRNARTGHARLLLKPLGTLDSLVFSPDGLTLVSSSEIDPVGTKPGGRVQLWDTRTGRLKRTLVNKIPVTSTIYSPDGRLRAAIIGEQDKRFAIEVYDAQTGRVLHTLRHKNSVYGFTFTADSRLLISGGGGSMEDREAQGSLNLWTVPSGRLLHAYSMKTPVLSVAISPDNAEIATGLGNDTVRTWSLHKR